MHAHLSSMPIHLDPCTLPIDKYVTERTLQQSKREETVRIGSELEEVFSLDPDDRIVKRKFKELQARIHSYSVSDAPLRTTWEIKDIDQLQELTGNCLEQKKKIV